RRGHVLERVMLSLRCPLPAIRVPQPTFELRQLGLPLRDVQPLVEEVPIHRRIGLALTSEDPSRDGAEPLTELLQFLRKQVRHRHKPLLPLLVELSPPPD